MPTITKKAILTERQFGGTPYGNATTLPFNLTTNAVGAATNSDLATGIASGDIVRIGVLPAGMRLDDALMIVSDAFTAAVTAKVGFAYVDGVDDAAVPQDDDYFAAALTLHTIGRFRANNNAVAPVRLNKDAYLILTTAGAANAAVGAVDILVQGVLLGAV